MPHSSCCCWRIEEAPVALVRGQSRPDRVVSHTALTSCLGNLPCCCAAAVARDIIAVMMISGSLFGIFICLFVCMGCKVTVIFGIFKFNVYFCKSIILKKQE